MYEIISIGDDNFNLIFSLVGVNKNYNLKNKELDDFVERLIKNKEEKLVIIDNEYYLTLNEKNKVKISESLKPIFIIIGGEASQEDISLMIKKVLGVDLLSKANNNTK